MSDAIEAEVASAEIEWSYREDDNKYPRDFWHVRLVWRGFDSGWTSYGEQEQRNLPENVKAKAEEDMRASLRGALTAAIDAAWTADRARAEKAEARVKVLEAALEPFAAEAFRYEPDEGDGDLTIWDCQLTLGQLRAARTAKEQS